jgi:hypothetical protein
LVARENDGAKSAATTASAADAPAAFRNHSRIDARGTTVSTATRLLALTASAASHSRIVSPAPGRCE